MTDTQLRSCSQEHTGGVFDGNLPLEPEDAAFIQAFDALFDTIDALVAAHQPASSPPQPNSGAKRYFRIRTESGRDSDGDGLSDRDEIMSYGTDPFYPDSDGDLFPDGIEVEACPSGAATNADSHPASVSELARWRRSVGYNYSEPGTGEIDSRSQGGAWKYQSNLGSPIGHDEVVNKWLFSANPLDPGSSHTFPDQPGGDGYVHWEGDSNSAYSLAERSFHPGTAQEIDVVGYGQSRIWLEQLPVSKLPVETTVLKTIRHKTGPFGATTVATTFDFLTLTTPAWNSRSEPADLITPLATTPSTGNINYISVSLTKLNLDLRADANRDGRITPIDEAGEDNFASGGQGRGAIILVNCDDDQGNDIPDNWPGAIPAWHNGMLRDTVDSPPYSINTHPLGIPRPEWIPQGHLGDYVVNGESDLEDCGRIRLYRTGALPTGTEISLVVKARTDKVEPEYFGENQPKIKAEHRVRIFLPTTSEGGNLIPSGSDVEIIGPGAGRQVKFTDSPDLSKNEHDIALVTGDGYLEFAVEGLEFAAETELHVSISKLGGDLVIPPRQLDSIILKCAPFVLASNLNPVDSTLLHAWMPRFLYQDFGFDNAAFNAAFDTADGVDTTILQPGDGNLYPQDMYEIGYTQAPGLDGPRTLSVCLTLPRYSDDPFLDSLLGDGTGVFYKFNYPAWVNPGSTDSINFGGNIECTPPVEGHPLGRILIGTIGDGHAGFGRQNFDENLLNFFYAQDAQEPLELDVEFLDLRHIDEVISIVPNTSTAAPLDFKILLASPNRVLELIDEIVTLQNNDGDPPGSLPIDFLASERTYRITIDRYLANDLPEIFENNGFEPITQNDPLATHKIREYNDATDVFVEALKLDLETGLGLESQVYDVPVLFWRGVKSGATAVTGNLANLQVAGTNVITHQFGGLFDTTFSTNKDIPDEDWIGLFRDDFEDASGVDVEFPPLDWRYLQEQAGVHCASNRISSPYRDADRIWWKQNATNTQ